MGQPKDLKLARRAPPLKTYTDIEPPKIERVDGKEKWRMIQPKAGVTTILSDSEIERTSSRPRTIKRERSQAPHRAIEQRRPSSQRRIKQELPGDRHRPRQMSGPAPAAAAAAFDARRTQSYEPSRRRQAHRSDPPSDSSSSSDSSGPDSSDSSESEEESDPSSDSSSSGDSSSEDEANTSVYWPSTPASSIESSPPRTRRQQEKGVRGASANAVTASPSRRSAQSDASIGSGLAPLNFFIDVPARSLVEASQLTGRSRSHTSPAVAPTVSQVDRTAHSNCHHANNSSPRVLGFMPINRGFPPENAPTEPRAMRTGEARPADTPLHSAQRPDESMGGSVSGSSSLPFRGPRLVNDNPQQKGQQRRGPARPGRIMQTIEQSPVEPLSTTSSPKNLMSSRDSRVATPGPSSRRTAPPHASPGIFVTPRTMSVRPLPVAREHDSPQSMLRPQRKRTFDETGGTNSIPKAAEWERMMKRIKNHEKEMEQQRAQLEDTKRLLAEQKTRIDALEKRPRDEELVRHASVQTRFEEPDIAPLPDFALRGVSPAPVPCHRAERREERRRQNTYQTERRDKRKRRESSRVAQARVQQQERERIEQERQEDLELDQQLEQEQRREAERIQCAARRVQNNAQPGPVQRRPELLAAVQRQIQLDVFNRPLSGHNPELRFDDDDRPHISEATAFLMRLPQAFVLARLRRLIWGKEFFDTAHPGSVHMGCWVVSRRASCDLRMKMTDSGESHSFSFARLAVRLWHDERSIYSLVEHHNRQLKAGHTCHVDACMRPDHIVLESDRDAGERRRCKARGKCLGHRTVHKDGTRQIRKSCIFPPRGPFVRQ